MLKFSYFFKFLSFLKYNFKGYKFLSITFVNALFKVLLRANLTRQSCGILK